MKTSIRIITFTFVLFFLAANIYAQNVGKRWALVHELDNRNTYVDTTSIRLFESQLSVWTLIYYKSPQEINPIPYPIEKVKTQYLINTVTKRYSIIGALYYDERGRIVGESAKPRMIGGKDNFSMPIQTNSTIDIVLSRALNYVNSGKLDGGPIEYLGSEDVVEFNEDLSNQVSLKMSNGQNQPEQNSDGTEIVPVDVSYRNNDTKPTTQDDSYDEIVMEDESKVDKAESEKASDREYDNSKERSAKGVIFTDGKLFCYQVSSWRKKSIADAEAKKLINKGFNAFVVKAYIPQKGGYWYRVRVGYFDSLSEAESNKRSLR